MPAMGDHRSLSMCASYPNQLPPLLGEQLLQVLPGQQVWEERDGALWLRAVKVWPMPVTQGRTCLILW